MGWSFRLGFVAGSEIRVHVTFFLLLLWIGLVHLQEGTRAAIEGVVFVCAVFACVVLHELGHALAARRYGIRTPDITLLPIGGVARLERMPENPREEIVIALAGPAVNVVIAAVLVLALGALPDLSVAENIEDPQYGFFARLAAVNIFLVLFNMIPAFPMDGGRVLRAALALRTGRQKATEIAARIGQALAFAFGFLGLIGGNPILIFIAIFVYLAAAAEADATGLMAMARKSTITEAMITSYEALGPQSALSDAADALIRTTQHEFPVVDGSGRPRGVLTRGAMLSGLQRGGPDLPVLEAMVDMPQVPATAGLETAVETMQAGAPAVAVVDGSGRMVGYITRENLGEMVLLHAADPRR